jgi:hypothetical protein
MYPTKAAKTASKTTIPNMLRNAMLFLYFVNVLSAFFSDSSIDLSNVSRIVISCAASGT